MDALIKDTQYNFRTNAALLEEAKKIAAEENFDMATIMNSLLLKIVKQKNVPVELIEEKATRHKKIVDELYSEIQKGYDSFLAGKYKPLDEVFSKYEL